MDDTTSQVAAPAPAQEPMQEVVYSLPAAPLSASLEQPAEQREAPASISAADARRPTTRDAAARQNGSSIPTNGVAAVGPLPWTSAVPLSEGPPDVGGLKTEVMHAPPRLPNDAKYLPLDPDRIELTGAALRKRTAQGPSEMASERTPGAVPTGIKLVNKTNGEQKAPSLRKRALRPRCDASPHSLIICDSC
jgi:hypothetical protein